VKTLLAVAVTALVTAGGAFALSQAAPAVPPCPHPSYGADGNMGPLFCMIDDPVALRYFAPMAKHTFSLTPSATPEQVAAALVADYKHAGTEPILCSIYQLADWRNHWSFGISAAEQAGTELRFPSNWCRDPRFSGAG